MSVKESMLKTSGEWMDKVGVARVAESELLQAKTVLRQCEVTCGNARDAENRAWRAMSDEAKTLVEAERQLNAASKGGKR